MFDNIRTPFPGPGAHILSLRGPGKPPRPKETTDGLSGRPSWGLSRDVGGRLWRDRELDAPAPSPGPPDQLTG